MLNDIYQGLDPIAFSLGPLVVRWYGLAYVLGFVCAAAIIYFVAKRWKLGMSEDNLLTLMVCAIVGVVLGARIGYVLFYGDGYYLSHPLEILAFNQGGMSFHGGLVGLLVGGAVAARMTRIPFLTLADLGSIAAPIGLFFGRCANFVNGELWGAPTSLPRGAWCSAARRVRCRVIPRSFTRRCSRVPCCSACCTPCRASSRRVRRGRFWACSWLATACSASSSNSFASPMRRSATCGEDG